MAQNQEKKYVTVVLELPADSTARGEALREFPLYGEVAGATVVALAHGNAIREAEILGVAAGPAIVSRAKGFINETSQEEDVERMARQYPPECRTVDALDVFREPSRRNSQF